MKMGNVWHVARVVIGAGTEGTGVVVVRNGEQTPAALMFL